jgi:hypothetical protein
VNDDLAERLKADAAHHADHARRWLALSKVACAALACSLFSVLAAFAEWHVAWAVSIALMCVFLAPVCVLGVRLRLEDRRHTCVPPTGGDAR